MKYLVIVSDDNGAIIEKLTFSYHDEALYYLECRRKQGYYVTIEPIEL